MANVYLELHKAGGLTPPRHAVTDGSPQPVVVSQRAITWSLRAPKVPLAVDAATARRLQTINRVSLGLAVVLAVLVVLTAVNLLQLTVTGGSPSSGRVLLVNLFTLAAVVVLLVVTVGRPQPVPKQIGRELLVADVPDPVAEEWHAANHGDGIRVVRPGIDQTGLDQR